MFALVILIACGAAPNPGGGASSDSGDPFADWAPPPVDDTRAAAVWSVAEAEAALGALARRPLPAPRVARDAYFALMAQGDAACPGDPLQLMDTRVPLEGCTAASGVRFAGISRWLSGSAVEGSTDPASFLLYGDMHITDREGDSLVVGGFARLQVTTSNGRQMYSGEVTGSWVQDNGPEWLGPGLSGTLTMNHFSGGGGPTDAVVAGGLHTPDGTAYFESLAFSPSCGGAASGAIGVRDPSGGWWHYDLSAESCTGCGALWYEADAPIRSCVDVTPLLASIERALEPT